MLKVRRIVNICESLIESRYS